MEWRLVPSFGKCLRAPAWCVGEGSVVGRGGWNKGQTQISGGSWPQTEHRAALSVHGLVAKRPSFLPRERARNSLSACMMFELPLMNE